MVNFFGDLENFALDEHGSLKTPDVDNFVEAFTSTLLSDPLSVDIGPSGHVLNVDTLARSGSPGTEDKIDALSNILESNLRRVENTDNMLLAIARVDAEVGKATREVDSVATPPGQIFNPNNPRSVSAFRKCTAEENPEGDEDCYIIKADASFIDDSVNAAHESTHGTTADY